MNKSQSAGERGSWSSNWYPFAGPTLGVREMARRPRLNTNGPFTRRLVHTLVETNYREQVLETRLLPIGPALLVFKGSSLLLALCGMTI